MHQVIHHDLTNEMVALQGLLHELSTYESRQLSAVGKDYVQRMQCATTRICEQVRFLKAMERMNTLATKPESIAFSTLASDLKGELARRRSDVEFSFAWDWEASATCVGDRRTLCLALAELLVALIGPDAWQCRASVTSRNLGDRVELGFQLHARHAAWTDKAVSERMETVLAREWLALSAADLQVMLPADGTARLLISIPNRATDA